MDESMKSILAARRRRDSGTYLEALSRPPARCQHATHSSHFVPVAPTLRPESTGMDCRLRRSSKNNPERLEILIVF